MTDINPCFMHHLHRQSIDPIGRLRACGKDLEPRIQGLQETMRHLAAATVTGT